MLNLFDEPLIPGSRSANRFLSAAEEGALIKQMEALDLAPFRFEGLSAKRGRSGRCTARSEYLYPAHGE
jgi:hypothetical protein